MRVRASLLAQRNRVDAQKVDNVLVERAIVMEIAACPSNFGAAFVEHARQKRVAAEAAGKGDGEILEWINRNAKHKRTPWEIEQWSDYQQRRPPDSDAETLAMFAEMVGKLSTTREDIKAWADLLDLDDYVSFGGKA